MTHFEIFRSQLGEGIRRRARPTQRVGLRSVWSLARPPKGMADTVPARDQNGPLTPSPSPTSSPIPLLLFFSLASLGTPVSALGVEVQPARAELTISAEQPTEGNFKLTNSSSRPVRVRIASGVYRSFSPGTSVPSAQGWLSFQPEELTMAPWTSSIIWYTVTPPPTIQQDTAGEYLAAILIDEFPEEEGNQANPSGAESPAANGRLTVVPRFAMPVYLKVKGKERVDVEISNLSLKPTKTPELFLVEISLKNQGTIHVRPGGSLVILDAGGNLLTTYPLGKTFPLLPSATMTIPAFVSLPKPGRYTALAMVDVQGEEPLQKEVPFEVGSNGRLLGEH